MSNIVTRFDTNKDAMSHSCARFDAQVLESDSESEIKAIYDSILGIAHESLVDPRFILAILMQESFGCVRVPSTSYGHRNPGLMQAHNGDGTCNDNGHVQTPCPSTVINAMIYDGTMGTDDGDGLVQYINKAPGEDVSVFYRAARMYNSGSIDPSGDLAKGIATHCYASDIANRLTGWVQGDGCTFDG